MLAKNRDRVCPKGDSRKCSFRKRTSHPLDMRVDLSSEKIFQTRQLNYVIRRQNRANQARLWCGVYFVQVTLRVGSRHKIPDTFIEGDFDYHVRTRAEGGNSLPCSLTAIFSMSPEH